MKRYIALLTAMLMMVSLCACSVITEHNPFRPENSTEDGVEKVDVSGLKVGFLFPSDSEATDTMSRKEGIIKMQETTGLTDEQVFIEENVKKKNCEKTIDTLASEGCSLIISKNKALESIIMECARKYPDVEFCQEGGDSADENALANYHTFNTRLYEAYHVAGVLAGEKLVEMLNDGKTTPDRNIGFVASRKSPEAISCFTAFFLGVQRAYSDAHMLVRYVDGDGVYDNDGKAAKQLALANVSIMGQYVSTTAVAAVCAENGIPLVGNEIGLISAAPKQALTSALADWSVYYTYAVNCMLEGKKIDSDWCEGYKEGTNIISQLNDSILPENGLQAVKDREKEIRSGSAKVLNTEKMKIEGQTLESLIKDNGDYKKYRKYVKNHTFQESKLQSAPVFDLMIDGIEESTYDYIGEYEAQNSESEEDNN